MVTCAQQEKTCFGARMTGAGFGGCAIALVRADAAQDLAEAVTACYRAQTDLTPNVYVCTATQGADVVTDGPNGSAS
jgi:galactokinase